MRKCLDLISDSVLTKRTFVKSLAIKGNVLASLNTSRFKTAFKRPVKFWDLRGMSLGCPSVRAKVNTVRWCL